MHPAVLVEQLVNTGAPFRKRKAPSGFPLDAHRYAEMFCSMISGSAVRHKATYGSGEAFSFPSIKLKRWFGNGGFKRLNDHLGLIARADMYSFGNDGRTFGKRKAGGFETLAGIDRLTKPYAIADQGGLFLETCRQIAVQGYPGSLYDEDGCRIRKRQNAIQSTDNKGRAVVSNAKIRWAIPIQPGCYRHGTKDGFGLPVS